MAKVTRVFVKGITSVGEEREAIAVPIANDSLTVKDLTTDLQAKLQLSSSDRNYEMRLSGAGVLLNGSNLVQEVVKENEYLIICKIDSLHVILGLQGFVIRELHVSGFNICLGPKGCYQTTSVGSYGVTKSLYCVYPSTTCTHLCKIT